MKSDDIVSQMERLIGLERAKAYKQGFSDGIEFIKQSLSSDSGSKIEDFWNDEHGDDL